MCGVMWSIASLSLLQHNTTEGQAWARQQDDHEEKFFSLSCNSCMQSNACMCIHQKRSRQTKGSLSQIEFLYEV